MKYFSQFKVKNFGLAPVLAATLALSSCASLSGAEHQQNLAKLKYGMETSAVLNLLGAPDSVVRLSSQDARWIYVFKSKDKRGRNLFVDFKRGELSRTGELSGRELAASSENRESGVCTRRYHPEIMQEAPCLK